MDFPLLKTLEINENIVDFLDKKFYEFSLSNKLISAKESNDPVYISDTGVHTGNLCLWDDLEYKNFINTEILNLCSKQLNIDSKFINIHYTHFFDYRKGGKVNLHNHIFSEDFVLFVYMNTCSSGETVFYLNPDLSYKLNTQVKIKPTRGLGAVFSSMLFHEVEFTSEPKKIFVIGIKIYLNKKN
jgi:hypothetical protein